MQLEKNKIEELRNLLATPQRIVILAHTNPDGDAIGSSLAWAELLKSEGGFVARRLSGGGTVFHDKGNINFTFIAADENFDVKNNRFPAEVF